MTTSTPGESRWYAPSGQHESALSGRSASSEKRRSAASGKRRSAAAGGRWSVAAAVLGVALTGGCGTATETPPPAGPFPPRPAVVDVAGIVPCTEFSETQQERLGLRRSTPGEGKVNGRPSPACVWTSTSDLNYGTQTIPIGAEVAAADPDATIIQVNGFGAVRSAPNDPLTGGRPFCQVSVDVARGQSIRVQAGGSMDRPRSPEEMCRIATEATSMVMTTVVAAHG